MYVGKGTGDRMKHTNSGQSNNELLNEFYFRRLFLGDMSLVVHKVAKFSGSGEALEAEKLLINKYLPYCNKCSGREHDNEYDFKTKLAGVCFSQGFKQPEWLQSKFDFRFLFTPKGLFCKGVKLHERSPFEYAFNKFHVRLKKEAYRHFPEYSLQFVDVPESFSSHTVSSIGYGLYYKEFIERGGNPFSSLGVETSWIENAYKVGGFNNYLLPESKKKIKKLKLDMERHNYMNFDQSSHLIIYYRKTEDYVSMFRNDWNYKTDVYLN